jgi:hypothetical protein
MVGRFVLQIKLVLFRGNNVSNKILQNCFRNSDIVLTSIFFRLKRFNRLPVPLGRSSKNWRSKARNQPNHAMDVSEDTLQRVKMTQQYVNAPLSGPADFL